MREKIWTAALAAVLLLLPAASPAAQKADAPAIDPVAMQHLTRMCDFLKGLNAFVFRAEVNVDEVFQGGLTLQTSRTETIAVRRPDRARSDTVQDAEVKTITFDGANFSIFNQTRNSYSVIPAPGALDQALDKVLETYGVTAPLAELILSSPYETLTEGVLSGMYVGLRMVQGVPCHHLAFSQKDVDWQIWIADGKNPLPRKLVIVDKTLVGAPNYEAMLVDWKLNPRFKDSFFAFTPPPSATKIDIIPLAGQQTVSP
ncbi:DUF2092 domain-containing protein [Desulfovibrio sulfodismutans]|uniref:DUF2092 domain-containing protein n=1 Tax=Desulfolutivibrio sulfodismutans TaxID=63561 RepID=A0A7K3NQH0_9BACT|nr:DUF2092 domain-containing protein [Desulfolutivibrio sulfodismutans]NDY58454.1 DUF2092 domain-containing protein [Desulfolutivibrio sulfodismutans]